VYRRVEILRSAFCSSARGVFLTVYSFSKTCTCI